MQNTLQNDSPFCGFPEGFYRRTLGTLGVFIYVRPLIGFALAPTESPFHPMQTVRRDSNTKNRIQ